MRGLVALAGVSLVLSLAGCAEPGSSGQPAGPAQSPSEVFERRAAAVAEAWRAGPAKGAWRTGYVPLQDATVLPTDPGFDEDTKVAFGAGWFRTEVALPTAEPADGTIRFPDGPLRVPLVSADEAYRQLDRGDPPPCPGRPGSGRPTEPVTLPAGPDSGVGSVPSACIPLTVTKVTLGAVTVRTSRGQALVPAWLFTVAELDGPVARVAVAPSAVTPLPVLPTPIVPGPGTPPQNQELVPAQNLTAVDGATLAYRLGVGACDTGITPLVHESDDLVVVAGAVTRSTGVCTQQLKLAPVTVTLAAPLGARLVLDAMHGGPLLLVNAS